ncbi:serine O-acetyltransferase EpsC [Salinicola avicenniae]|uniref:serine O-acetyltransferase EpsC n=1 Tax=Salinicola avicenniae TaxID=2916836 RepID=UPI0020736594|nr:MULTISPECIES: serine O-acetyltransferase EpsC [unclassified Salinicola]
MSPTSHAWITRGNLWPTLLAAAETATRRDPLLAGLYRRCLLRADDLADALAIVIAETCASVDVPEGAALDKVAATLAADPKIADAAARDLLALLHEDAAIPEPFTPLLFFPGYRAVQCQRVAHRWWHQGLTDLASHLQYRASVQFAADIHPAARLGAGLFVDHGAGIVIGETAVVEDNVTLFHGVTLGGTGKLSGDRHPKVRRGAFLGAGASILGAIEVGENARVGAGAVVTRDVEANATVTGPIARPR